MKLRTILLFSVILIINLVSVYGAPIGGQKSVLVFSQVISIDIRTVRLDAYLSSQSIKRVGNTIYSYDQPSITFYYTILNPASKKKVLRINKQYSMRFDADVCQRSSNFGGWPGKSFGDYKIHEEDLNKSSDQGRVYHRSYSFSTSNGAYIRFRVRSQYGASSNYGNAIQQFYSPVFHIVYDDHTSLPTLPPSDPVGYYKPGNTITFNWNPTEELSNELFINRVSEKKGSSSFHSYSLVTDENRRDDIIASVTSSRYTSYSSRSWPQILVDHIPPTENQVAILATDDPGNQKFNLTHRYEVTDTRNDAGEPGSGVEGKSSVDWTMRNGTQELVDEIKKDKKKYKAVFIEAKDENNELIKDHWDMVFNQFLYDYIYEYEMQTNDNVGNYTDIKPEIFGRTRPPQTAGSALEIIQSNGNLYTNMLLQLGKRFDHEKIGYQQLEISYGDSGYKEIVTIDDSFNENILSQSDVGKLGYTYNEDFKYARIVVPTDFQKLPPHDVVSVQVKALYQDGTYSTNDLSFDLEVPNIELGQNNDFNLKFLREGEVISTLRYEDTIDQSTKRTLYFNSGFSLKVETENSGFDKEGDELWLEIEPKAGSTYSRKLTGEEISFTGSEGEIKSLKILEKSVGAANSSDYYKSYDLHLSFEQDAVDLENLNIISVLDSEANGVSTLPAVNDGLLNWNIDFTRLVGTEKKSRIESLTFFEYPDGAGDVPIGYAKYKELAAGEGFRKTFVPYDGSYDIPENYEFTLADLASDSEELRRTGLMIQDSAGNRMFVVKRVHYDRIAPPGLLSDSETVVKWYAEGDPEADAIRFFKYDPETRFLTLQLDNSAYNNGIDGLSRLNNCVITSTAADYISYVDDIDFEGQSTEANSIKLTLSDGFPSDIPLDFDLTFTDAAGNETVNNLRVYTPLYFPIASDQTAYLSRTDREWSEEIHNERPLYHHFRWDQIGLQQNELRLYPIDDSGVVADNALNGLFDPDVDAHDSKEYELRGVNRSLYESGPQVSSIRFTRDGINNSPVILGYSVEGSFADVDGKLYTGPNNTIDIRYRDYDETDSLTLQWFVDGVAYKEVQPLTNVVEGQANFSLSGFFDDLENNKSYELKYKIQDSWGENQGEGTVEFRNYVYDDEAPEMAYLFDQRDGFAYIYGDVHLKVTDNQAGLDEWTMTSAPEGTLCNGENSLEGYTHQVSLIPDGKEHVLVFDFEDRVGNVNKSASIGPFGKDSESPSLSAVKLGYKDKTVSDLFSRPLIPVSASWSDNVSGVDRIAYRFLNDDEVLKEGVSLKAGELTDLFSDTLDLSCTLSGTEVNDDEAYTLQIKLLDNAGNGGEAEWEEVSDTITMDSVLPIVRVTGVSGLKQSGGTYYYNGSQAASLQHSITDAHPGSEIWYEREHDGDINSSTSLSSLLGTMGEGDDYQIRVGTKDRAGNRGVSSWIPVVKDSNAPTAATLSLQSSGTMDVGSQVRFTFSAHDAASRVKSFKLWIGRKENEADVPVISSLLPGADENGLLSIDYVDGKIYTVNIPDVEAGSYFFKASVIDNAGNASPLTILSGQTLAIAASAERLVVHDYDSYSSERNSLKGWWEYEGEKILNHYSYRLIDASSGAPVGEWKTSFLNYGEVIVDSSFTEGNRYYFEVYARYEDGSKSGSRFSPGTIMDFSGPAIASAAVNQAGTLNDIKLNWSSSDSLSAVSRVEALVERYKRDESGNVLMTDDGAGNQVPLREALGLFDLGSDISSCGRAVMPAEYADALTVGDGEKLFVTLRVSDLAGNVSEKAAGVFIKDASAPPMPVVIDGGDYINPDKLAVSPLRFSWQWSSADDHSGVGSYHYQILESREDIDESAWIELNDVELSLNALGGSFANGSEILCAVKAVNGAGLSSIGYSDGIVLDNTKPDTARVVLTRGGNEEALYITGEKGGLILSSEDAQSGISRFEYEAGTFSGTEWVSLGPVSEAVASENAVDVDFPEGLVPFSVLYYRATAYNAAGDPSSLPGYSLGARYIDDAVVIRNLIGDSSNGELVFTWDTFSVLPVTNFSYSLKKSGVSVRSGSLDGSERSLRLEGLADGSYQLALSYEGADGLMGGDSVSSPIVRLDTTAPSVDRLYYDHYINDFLNYRFAIVDNLSGSGGYRYRVGPVGSPDLLTGGWVSDEDVESFVDESLSVLDDLQGGSDSLADGDTIVLALQVKDRSGNWSPVISSDPVLVDRSAPGAPLVGHNLTLVLDEEEFVQSDHYLYEADKADRLIIEGFDGESGIKGYVWALETVGSGSELDWSVLEIVDSEPGYKELKLSDHALAPVALDDGVQYRIHVKLVNKSGLYSPEASTPILTADLNAPEAVFDTENSGLDFKDELLVYNESGEVYLDVVNEKGDVLYFSYSLTGDDGYQSDVTETKLLGNEHKRLTALFEPSVADAYGNYTMNVDLTDAGGRTRRFSQKIRLNSPPFFTPDVVSSFPMKPFDLTFSNWIDDPDGVGGYEVVIHKGDEDVRYSFTTPGDITDLAYDHPAPYAGSTEYSYSVTAEDRYGQGMSAEGSFAIVNTTEGKLYTDEYWTGVHQLKGPVTVPSGLKLHVDNGTTVQVIQNLEDQEVPGIVVESGAEISHDGSAVYEVLEGTEGYRWKGLEVEGTGDFDNVRISGAERALTLISTGASSITGAVFEDNDIGLHLYGVSPDIGGCRFTDNRYYGIKEDGGSDPVVTGSAFFGNGFDYYDEDKTVLDFEGVNGLDGNFGNTGDIQ